MVNDIIMKAGYRARLIVPLVRPDRIVGAPVVSRLAPGEFPTATVELMETFARNRCWRSRMRACSARSPRRASS